jgi:hypothetical protein
MFWNWLFKICMSLKEFHGMCKHCLVVVFHILLWYVYSFFEQCKIFFINFHIHPSPCRPIQLFCQDFAFSILFPMFWFLIVQSHYTSHSGLPVKSNSLMLRSATWQQTFAFEKKCWWCSPTLHSLRKLST